MGSPKPERLPALVEDELIERIRSALGNELDTLGLRDDAALVQPPAPGSSLVASIDSVVEGVHFDRAFSTPADIGWKALMSALSDLAAMGAAPAGALMALCVPDLGGSDNDNDSVGATTAVGIMEGAAEASAASGCPVVGGDLSSGPVLTVVVSVLGSAPSGQAVTRAGAHAGDVLFVTGPCGASAAGLRLLRAGTSRDDQLVNRHLRPVARLAAGMAAASAGARALIDVSDGLALDLHRLADASSVGFELTDVPVAEGATLHEALGGGEDYELVLASPPDGCDRLLRAFVGADLSPPIRIGQTVADPATRTLAGSPLGRLGWQHGQPAG